METSPNGSGAMLADATSPDASRQTQQGAGTVARIKHHVQVMHMAWGLAWLIGYGLRFLGDGPGERVFVDLPDRLPQTVLLVLLAGAGATTAILGVRAFGRGTTDPRSTLQAKRYGTAWLVGFVGLIITIGKISSDLSPHQSELLWGATTTGLVGALHMSGSAIWGDREQFRMGLWLTLVNVIGVIAGPGWQALIICLGAGGVTVVLATHNLLRLSRNS
ncbi:transporter [Micromonospora pisi]|uniref:transporter n=1 Tax=Micromonospora pisi TaxID=589240 RepID=UPI001B86E89A|nr:transporter [Micromonospora pisi]